MDNSIFLAKFLSTYLIIMGVGILCNLKNYQKMALEYGSSAALMGQNNQALSDLCDAIKIDSKLAKAYKSRAALYVDAGEIDNAIQDFWEYLKINPKDAETYSIRAIIYSKNEQYDKAAADYTQIIKLSPKSADAYYNRGQMYLLNLVNVSRGCEDFKKACDLSSVCGNYETNLKKGSAVSSLWTYTPGHILSFIFRAAINMAATITIHVNHENDRPTADAAIFNIFLITDAAINNNIDHLPAIGA